MTFKENKTGQKQECEPGGAGLSFSKPSEDASLCLFLLLWWIFVAGFSEV